MNYKKKRAESKKSNTDELLANAKREIRRLEDGIDKVLYQLSTEDSSDSRVISEITADLINLYNGKEIK